MRPHLGLLALALGCAYPDQPLDSKDSPAPDSIDTGLDSPDPETATETDTGAPPDTHETGESDSTVDTDTGSAPVTCDASLKWRFVEAGMYQTCGIHTDGCAECWGVGEEESSGNPFDTASYYWEGEDKPPPSAYQSIVMINTNSESHWRYHACGLTELGEALCWGEDGYGETSEDTGIYTDLAIWADGTFSLDTAGTVGVWGLGVLPPTDAYVDIAVATSYGLALTADGTVETWDVEWEHDIDNLDDKYLAVDLGASACGVRMDGSLRCWNEETPNDDWPNPIETDVPEGVYTDVCVAGSDRACALDAAGAVTCWGDNWAAEDPPEGVVYTQIACGWAHACGLTPEGEIKCWGYNSYGEGTPPT